jgi:hypothetical protein
LAAIVQVHSTPGKRNTGLEVKMGQTQEGEVTLDPVRIHRHAHVYAWSDGQPPLGFSGQERRYYRPSRATCALDTCDPDGLPLALRRMPDTFNPHSLDDRLQDRGAIRPMGQNRARF